MRHAQLADMLVLPCPVQSHSYLRPSKRASAPPGPEASWLPQQRAAYRQLRGGIGSART